MKKKLIITILISASMLVSGQSIYYLSQGGSDLNNGKTPATPWQTIKKLNYMFSSFGPGDKILFKSNGTYYGSIIVTNSGTEKNPIIISSYGKGARPIITGLTKVRGWINSGNNIWESKLPVSSLSSCNMVVINGKNTAMGRYPNTGYLKIQSHIGKTAISSNALKSNNNWTGAELIVRMWHWGLDRNKIVSHEGNILTYKSDDTLWEPIDGYGFFIQNDSKTLDTLNEWYYNPRNKKLKVYSIKTPKNVSLATIDTLVFINGSNNISFSKISFQGSNKIILKCLYSKKISINDCEFNFSGLSAINASLGSDHLIVNNCRIYNSNEIGIINDTSTHAAITNNTVKNSGVFPGMGSVFHSNPVTSLTSIGYYGAIMSIGAYGNISNNKIDSIGYIPIYFGGDSTIVQNNFIDTYCFILDDGGGIYSYSEFANKRWLMRTIKNNIILNGIGAGHGTENITGYDNQTAGIYLDQSNSDYNLIGNTVANAHKGIFLNNAHEVNIDSNTLYNNVINLFVRNYNKAVQMKNISVHNNILITTKAAQIAVGVDLLKDSLMPVTYKSDNNYYAQSLDDSMIVSFNNTKMRKAYSLPLWQLSSPQDIHSKNSPIKIVNINNVRFEYNETSTVKKIILAGVYADIKGTSYSGVIKLAPHSSVVLFRK